ncbi:inner membrane protein YhjD [Mycobacterium haemophilum]|uniref:Membrane protein n=1 Tax=Mycobacterium haemophilum TaxID=29311 RepID=A0A0I9UIN3_9MYCO|nr:inner membrane protein YhjD [Mycobacterium haemophilum]KLO33677.1 membrane protein [Mycobacterium haemophilum]KLO39205.1 membrane protein [Mycobacterium haemophilum]KLO41793.1 membrane protein [Mycobacterium haemophilum]KLO49823.1 membrane protein [Mycobacterium haemophilum]
MTEPANTGIVDRLRARFGWLDHVVRAYLRFDQRNGSFFAAGLTYYTIFALFPLLMVSVSVVGFVLSRRPELLTTIDDHIRSAASGRLGQELVDLVNRAIDARASVGVVGLATAAWAGLGWMSHLRAALTEMWWEQRIDSPGFLRNKLSDLLAMVGTFVVTLVTLALTVLGHQAPMAMILRWLGISNFSVLGVLFQGASIAVSMLVSWLLFTWMIARLPRESVSLVASMRGGLIAAVGFELFKQVGSIYLQIVLRSPAGRAFGPVLGVMVFAYVTAYLVLFAAAWAATAAAGSRAKPVEPSVPVVIFPRVAANAGLSTRQALAAMAVGAVGVLAFSRLARRALGPRLS